MVRSNRISLAAISQPHSQLSDTANTAESPDGFSVLERRSITDRQTDLTSDDMTSLFSTSRTPGDAATSGPAALHGSVAARLAEAYRSIGVTGPISDVEEDEEEE
eukprot:Hpha_TRINITY_DN25255_c0_g1::TRINITY_DN25255_c0_g1_i1::g.110800::m.110800